MSEIFVGRQPICTPELEIAAYELLFRSGETNDARVIDGDVATATVIHNTFIEIGPENVIGDSPAFINATRNYLLSDHWRSLPKERVTLEVLEDISPDTEIMTALSDISEAGYTIALDDFVYSPELVPLVEAADVIKVEFPAIKREDLASHVAVLRNYNVKLLAEKIETYEDFDLCKSLGFDLFQGYFFCKPKVIGNRKLPSNKQAALLLIAKLQEEDIQLGELETIIKSDVALSYKLLKFVNSCATSVTREIESIRDAIIMAGVGRLKSWATIMALAGFGDKPNELLTTAIVRARMGELLATKRQDDKPEKFFTAGLFSLLPAFLDQPMEQILASLPIERDLSNALLTGTGSIGDTLRCITNYEQGNWDQVACDKTSDNSIRNSYLEAVSWSRGLLSTVT